MTDVSPPTAKVYGHYRVQGRLGAGGMGVVYSAYDTVLEREVAIKVMVDRGPVNRTARDLLLREARAASSLNHPNICTIHEVGDSDGEAYIVMEQVEGQPLSSLCGTNGLSPDLVVRYGVQIADALAHAHEHGVIHRDLKSTNVMVTPEGRVKVLDFGLAARLRDSEFQEATSSKLPLTESRMVVGTLPYLAPELLRGEPAEPRTDTWALGVLLYEMASGTHPFRGRTAFELSSAILREPPTPLPVSVPSSLGTVILRCLEKSPGDRHQRASEVHSALDAVRGFQPDLVPRPAVKRFRASPWLLLVAPLLIVALLLYFRVHHNKRLTESDTVVLTDFDNSTGDPVFDDTLKTALNVSLRQSPFLNVVPDSKVAKTLQLMTLPASTKLTPEIARELGQRAGSKAFIAGSIGRLGSEYVLGLKVVNCQSGDTLAQEQVTAASKEKVLDTLGKAASKLRGELGESLATVQRFDVPLAQSTTNSLEALKALSLGRKASYENGSDAALPYLERAIQLDPNFAMGYLAVGADYATRDELGRASEYFTKAFQLREHASEREKQVITSIYYLNVTGELDKAAQTYEEQIESYPREEGAYLNLGGVFASQGQYQNAAQITRQALRLSPDYVAVYEGLANLGVALQRFDDARQVIHQAQARKLDDFVLHTVSYALAFLGRGSAAMEEQQKWLASRPEYENLGLSLASDTEAYSGHLRRARELTKRAVGSAVRADSKENGALAQALAAQREAAYGYSGEAMLAATEALKLAPASQGVAAESALAFAMAGNTARTESLAQDLEKRFPLYTQMQSIWLPAIHGQLALDRKNPPLAVTALQAPSDIELGQMGFVINLSCLYSVYVRGEAYLAAGQGSAAAAEFQRIIDHNGIVWNCWTGALAHLGVARANTLEAKTSQGADADAARVRALAAYKDFLTLWKDADPDIPLLIAAKAEYAKLL
jgi:eukaryotic-like serine/threonine-protein kinase